MWLGRRLTRLGRRKLHGGSSSASLPSAMGRFGLDEAGVYGVEESLASFLIVVGGSEDDRRRADG